MRLPEHGMSTDEIVGALTEKRRDDVRWQEGRTFGMVYDAGPETHDVIAATALMFLHDNALNTQAFPSLGAIQSEVVGVTADLLHGGPEAAGFLTSGGTESILMAVHAAIERARAERDVTEPEIVLPVSAHAAFHKAAHYFGARIRKVPVDADWRADVDTAADLVGPDTVLVVGSAPQYPQGVVDPIPDLAALAQSVGASFHTDACMGGFVLPFMEQLGMDVPPWDFRVEGVTTISADVHKLGYAPKGASVILHRTKGLRRYQTFVFEDWLGGFYASPNMQGTARGCRWPRPGRCCTTSGSRATAASPRRRSRPPTACVRACARSTGSRCSATRTHTCWRSPPTGPPNGPWTRSRSATRSCGAAGSTTARSHPTRCTPPSVPATRRSSRSTSSTSPRVWTRSRVRAPRTAAPRTPRSSSGGQPAFVNGWATKNFHMISSALTLMVVGPTMFAMLTEKSLPGHVWPPPSTR